MTINGHQVSKGDTLKISMVETQRRTIIDGVHIENGDATGDALRHQFGGAAVVPDYGHIRNCILRKNTAAMGGGALYLHPKALVSGCLFEHNRARQGGAVFVKPVPDNEETVDTRARIFTSTFVRNAATKAGGGISYFNNVRVNSSVFWANMGNTESNVEGRLENMQTNYTVEDYPFAYSAVENMRKIGRAHV